MSEINLHQIFRHLTQDDKLLSTVIDNTKKIPKKPNQTKSINNSGKNFDMMSSMITEYVPLAPYETQSYGSFPQPIKNYLTPNYMRVGIKNIIEKDMVNTNVSFLNSLNILLRPDIYYLNNDDYIKDLPLLEEFIKHRITRNFQIDKVIKNTKKIQEINKGFVKNISEGKITHDLIQYIVNIFEINLIVFDFISYDITVYWTHGSKHADLNVFKNIHCMAYVQGNYEPILPKNNSMSKDHMHRMYIKILTDQTIKSPKEINIGICALIALNTWNNVSDDAFIDIVEKYFSPRDPDM